MTTPLPFRALAKYAQFKGRARRSEFWLWVLMCVVTAIALDIFYPQFVASATQAFLFAPGMAAYGTVIDTVPALVGLVMVLPSLSVAVRRLHDIGRSGWLVALPLGTAAGGAIVFTLISGILVANMGREHPGSPSGGEGLGIVFAILALFVVCVVLPTFITLVIMVNFWSSPGTQGPNRFGPDPKSHKPKLPNA